MIRVPSTFLRRLTPALILAAFLSGAVAQGRPARAEGLSVAQAAGSWDLSFEKGNRRCRLMLRPEAGLVGSALALPAGCHRAFPVLSTVAGWTAGEKSHILLQARSGQTVLDFGPSGGPNVSAVVGEEGDIYMLTPVDQDVQAALVEAASPVEVPGSEPAASPGALGSGEGGVLVDATTRAPIVAAAPAVFPPATMAELVGNYAVVRQNRDTGCMVTLEAEGGGKAEQKARLAPACRDQGIVIFDPVGWQLSKGQLILTAKKGHKAVMARRAERTWATNPAKGAALVLKGL